MLSAVVVYLVAQGVVPAAAPVPAHGRVPTVDDLATLREMDDVQLSPDGLRIAYVSNDSIWVADAAAHQTPKAVHQGRSPRWSPDGTRLAFFVEDTKQQGAVPLLNRLGQLWILDRSSGTSRQLTRIDGGVVATPTFVAAVRPSNSVFSWSPDGGKIALVARSPTGTPGATNWDDRMRFDSTRVVELNRESPAALVTLGVFRGGKGVWSYAFAHGRNQVLVIDVATGDIKEVTHDSDEYFAPTWTPDGKRVVASGGRGPPVTYYQVPVPRVTDIYTVDIASKRRTRLTSGPDLKSWPSVSPDGRSVAYVATDGYEGFPRLMVVPLAGGPALRRSERIKRPVQMFAWRKDSQSLLLQVLDGTGDLLVQLDLRGGTIKPVTGVSGYPKRVTTSASGAIAWIESNPRQEGLLRVLQPGDSTPQDVLDLNPQTTTWRLGTQEVVRWRTTRGDSAEGVLLKPVDYVVGRRYPMIVDAYPVQSNGFQGRLYAMNQTLAGRGYLVFFAAHRATHTAELYRKSESYNDIARGIRGGDVTLDDVSSGIDFLISQGLADSSRLGLFGHSNGGGSAAYLLTRMTRFKVAFISAPVATNWQLLLGLLGTLDYPLALFGGQPWDVPNTYVSASAVFRLGHIHTPLVLAVGDHDAPSLLDAIQLYNGLRRLERAVTLVRYPQAGHVIAHASPAYRSDFWSRVYSTFESYLKEAPPRGDSVH